MIDLRTGQPPIFHEMTVTRSAVVCSRCGIAPTTLPVEVAIAHAVQTQPRIHETAAERRLGDPRLR